MAKGPKAWRGFDPMGYRARNRGNSQGSAPTFGPLTCKARWSGYGRLPAGIKEHGSQRSGIMSTTSIASGRPTLASSGNAAPGVDGETWQHYGEDLEGNLQELCSRLKRGAYRAKPVKWSNFLRDVKRPRRHV